MFSFFNVCSFNVNARDRINIRNGMKALSSEIVFETRTLCNFDEAAIAKSTPRADGDNYSNNRVEPP